MTKIKILSNNMQKKNIEKQIPKITNGHIFIGKIMTFILKTIQYKTIIMIIYKIK